tara:strand:- start:83 stop:289 length:207 start_codon:yes stop_codon:yes gene_type:complete
MLKNMKILKEQEKERLFRIGVERVKKFDEDFDELYDKYKAKAKEKGFEGELKFVTEKSKVIIYVTIFL